MRIHWDNHHQLEYTHSCLIYSALDEGKTRDVDLERLDRLSCPANRPRFLWSSTLSLELLLRSGGRVFATTPLIASRSLVPISIFGIVTVVLPIFGVFTAVIARAHGLSTLLVKLSTATVRI